MTRMVMFQKAIVGAKPPVISCGLARQLGCRFKVKQKKGYLEAVRPDHIVRGGS
jgi:hypothetical protein